jgi:hypothetical protein
MRSGSEGGEVGVQPDPAETALVEQPQRAPVVEGDREPDPVRPAVGLLHGAAGDPVAALGEVTGATGDQDPAAHPQVHPEHRTVVRRLAPQRLALPARHGERAAEQRRADLAGRVGAALPRVVVVDVDDPPVQRGPLDRRAGALDLGQLRHVSQSGP